MDLETFQWILGGWIALAVVIFLINLRIVAPYGRHTKRTWGPMIDNRLGWFLMETPVLLIFPLLFFLGPTEKSPLSYLFLGLYILHYAHRALIFPWRLRTRGKKMPIVIMFSAIFFNLVNAGALGIYFGFLAAPVPDRWAYHPAFWMGLVLFFSGMAVNWDSDTRLLNLRKPGETGYKIPRGGLFRYLSCPNLFGEIVEWSGFALLTFSLPGLAFAIWTAANLIPRGLAHHRWYQGKFEDYPPERRAIFPFLL